MRTAAEERIREELGPMMRSTREAVVVELIGHDRMLSSLVYSQYKFNYDFLSKSFEVYDLKQDPAEQHNLFDMEPQLASRAIESINQYRNVRAATANFILRPDDER
jgi:hypothetical protein